MTAFAGMRQLGRLYQRLTHPKAACNVCGGIPGVVDSCRVTYGELLCSSCDTERHSASPCARTRHALLHISSLSRPVLVNLHQNEFIHPTSSDLKPIPGRIMSRDWIVSRGVCSRDTLFPVSLTLSLSLSLSLSLFCLSSIFSPLALPAPHCGPACPNPDCGSLESEPHGWDDAISSVSMKVYCQTRE
jgi:hypothetical protein